MKAILRMSALALLVSCGSSGGEESNFWDATEEFRKSYTGTVESNSGAMVTVNSNLQLKKIQEIGSCTYMYTGEITEITGTLNEDGRVSHSIHFIYNDIYKLEGGSECDEYLNGKRERDLYADNGAFTYDGLNSILKEIY